MCAYTRITPNHELHATRFESGLTIYDEALCQNRYISRYWSASGQILPEMHLAEEAFLKKARQFPLDSFRLCMEGTDLTQFRLVGQGETEDTSGLFSCGKVWKTTLKSLEADVTVTVCTRIDGSPFLVRWLEITNDAPEAAGIDSVCPMAGRVWFHDGVGRQYPPNVEESGKTTDFSLAYCHHMDWGTEGDFYYEPLAPGDFCFDGGKKGRSGWSRPAFWLRDNQSGQVLAVEFAYSGNWEFHVLADKTRETVQAGFTMGIPAMEGEFIRVLAPGETVATPAVHAALFPCAPTQTIVQAYHTHMREVVMPKPPVGREVEIEANHRGYQCDRESEEGILADIDVAAAVGAELYVVDAGWYGPMPNKWWDNVGDWYCGQWLPNGLKPIADHAHKKGMGFGLWIEIEAVGKNAALGKEHPEWRMMRNGEYCAPYEDCEGGRALDLSQPEVVAWIEASVSRLIDEVGLDMYRIDHNHCMGPGGNRIRLGKKENVLWAYYENFYRLHRRLREKYPDVVFQNCAGGGGRLDFGMLNGFHNVEVSDWTRPPRVGKIFNNLSMFLPPEKMLTIFGTETRCLELEYNLFAQLCVVLGSRPIFRGIAPSVEEMNPLLRDTLKKYTDLYKTVLRPILKNAVVWHHTPMLPIFEPGLYTAMEYAAPDQNCAFIVVRSLEATAAHRICIYPRSIDPAQKYRIFLQNQNVSWTVSGYELFEQGITIDCQTEIILLESVK